MQKLEQCEVDSTGKWSNSYLENNLYITVFLPSLLWLILWLIPGLGFFYNFNKQTTQTIEELHSIENRAYAIVAAQRRLHFFDKQMRDPRRYLELFAIFLELPYCTLSTMYPVIHMHSNMQFLKFTSNGYMKLAQFVGGLLCLFLIGIIWMIRTKKNDYNFILKNILFQVVFDTAFLPILDGFYSMLFCSNGIQEIQFLDVSCQCRNVYHATFVISLSGIVVLCFGSLFFKAKMEPNDYSLPFRFQTSFAIIVVLLRSFIPLKITLYGIYQYPLLTYYLGHFFPALDFVLFGSAFLYNYKHQPCLGSGYLVNNFRALTFCGAFMGSVISLLYCFPKTLGIEQVSDTTIVLCSFPVVLLITWIFNAKQAQKFHVPNTSIVELLKSEKLYLKEIGALSTILMSHHLLSDVQQKDIYKELRILYSMTLPTNLQAYVCAALWFLNKRFEHDHLLISEKASNENINMIPENTWKTLLYGTEAKRKIFDYITIRSSTVVPLGLDHQMSTTESEGVENCNETFITYPIVNPRNFSTVRTLEKSLLKCASTDLIKSSQLLSRLINLLDNKPFSKLIENSKKGRAGNSNSNSGSWHRVFDECNKSRFYASTFLLNLYLKSEVVLSYKSFARMICLQFRSKKLRLIKEAIKTILSSAELYHTIVELVKYNQEFLLLEDMSFGFLHAEKVSLMNVFITRIWLNTKLDICSQNTITNLLNPKYKFLSNLRALLYSCNMTVTLSKKIEQFIESLYTCAKFEWDQNQIEKTSITSSVVSKTSSLLKKCKISSSVSDIDKNRSFNAIANLWDEVKCRRELREMCVLILKSTLKKSKKNNNNMITAWRYRQKVKFIRKSLNTIPGLNSYFGTRFSKSDIISIRKHLGISLGTEGDKEERIMSSKVVDLFVQVKNE